MTNTYYKSLILFLFIAISTLAKAQSTKFQRTIGGTGDDRSYSMAQTKDGGYILTGYTTSFGTGGQDIYLTKTDGLGKLIWSKTYGTSGNETGWKVKQTADSGYIVVGSSSANKRDGVLFKTDLNGTLKWGKFFNNDSAEAIYNVIESKADGAFYVTGFIKTDSFGTDAFLTKYSSAGSLVWQTKFGAAGNEEGYGLVEELNGNIAVVGVVVDDTITVGGIKGSAGDKDIFIARFDKDGNNKWIKNYGTVTEDQAWDIKYLKGEYITTGWTASSTIGGDILLTIIDTSGNFKKAFSYIGAGSSKAFSVIINPDESYSLTGYINTATNGREAFYLNTNNTGNVGSFSQLGGASTDGHWPSEITRTIDGGFSIFTSSNSFKTNSSYDLYLIRMDDRGAVDCNQTVASVQNQSISMQSGKFGSIRYGAKYTNISLTTKTITTNKDSVLCCKLQAQVAGPTIRICKGESVRIGKPSIPGYVYKWTAIGSSFTSNESSPLVNPSGNITYKLVVSSSDGKCIKDSATVALSIRAVLSNKNFVRDTFFCAGDTVKITARSGAINYSWVGKRTTLNGQTVFLSKQDTIILTITDTTTCKYTDTMKILLKKLPVFNLGNDTTICDNTKITLSGPANMKTYLWNGGQTKTRNLVTSEERIHTLAVVDSFGCRASDSKNISIYPSSTFTLGPDTSMCKGINYTILGPGFLSNYYWNGVQSFSANKVTNTPGTYILVAQNTYGCKATDTIVLKAKPDPVFSLGPDGGVCITGGRTLTGPSGVAKYQWDDGSTNKTYEVSAAGKYWLKVTGTNGCIYTDTIKLTLVANPVPELGNDTTICDKDSIYLDAGNFSSYKWNTGETTRILKVRKANLYEVTVTDANTCKGIDEKSVKTKVCPNAINTIKIPGLKVQPNPAFNKLNIEWLANGKGASLTLFDIRGTKIFEQQAEPGLGQYSIDVSQYSRGIYYLKVTTEAASQSIKIVLE